MHFHQQYLLQFITIIVLHIHVSPHDVSVKENVTYNTVHDAPYSSTTIGYLDASIHRKANSFAVFENTVEISIHAMAIVPCLLYVHNIPKINIKTLDTDGQWSLDSS